MLGDIETCLRACGLELIFWRHPGRADGVGIAYRAAVLTHSRTDALAHGPVVTGVLECLHASSGLRMRAISAHLRGRDGA